MLERYQHDLRLIRGSQAWVVAALVVGFALLFPLLVKGYLVYNATLFLVYALMALSLGLLVGFTGQVSLGHAGFLAVGAYAQALMTQQGVPFLLSVPLVMLVAAAVGLVIGVPALRLQGPYLAIATLGFGLAVQQVLNNWSLVGASTGMLVDRPTVLGAAFHGDVAYYYLSLALAFACGLMIFNLERSHVGRAFRAVRDAELAAQMSGIGLARYKSLAFVLSASVAGLAGALYGPLIGYVTPESFNLLLSIKFLLMIVVGGLGFLPGALLGAAFITGLDVVLSGFRAWSQLAFGAVVVLLMVLEPRGLYGRWLAIRRFWKTWPL